jgi:hypothetical protein
MFTIYSNFQLVNPTKRSDILSSTQLKLYRSLFGGYWPQDSRVEYVAIPI